MDQALRQGMWTVIVESRVGLGQESIFEFKYIPDVSRMTGQEDCTSTGITKPGIERRNLKAFLCGLFVVTFVPYLAFKMVANLVTTLA